MRVIHEFSTDIAKILAARKKAAQIMNRAIARIDAEQAANEAQAKLDADEESKEILEYKK